MNLVLFGAGSAGRYTLSHLRSQGLEPLCFADNDVSKQNSAGIAGISVLSPIDAQKKYPDATWVATVISAPAREIRQQMREMEVSCKPLHEVLPCHHDNMPDNVYRELLHLAGDSVTRTALVDQFVFRNWPDYDHQEPPDSCADIYFPDFILHRDDEVFCDLGAASGDTVQMFIDKWYRFKHIAAFEPDRINFRRLEKEHGDDPFVSLHDVAVADVDRKVMFKETGDYSARLVGNEHNELGKEYRVQCVTLDGFNEEGCFDHSPTYIKMDIEGAELQALWGARKIIKNYSPVLAVCAYHDSSHLWDVPLLIHALNPAYSLFLRRYAEGTWELVWYAVPKDRLK